jgi:hypothetical protein
VIGSIVAREESITISGGTGENGEYVTGSVEQLCSSGERAISAGTSWSDTDSDLELFVRSMRPVVDGNGSVVGFVARGGNDSGQSSTFTLHVLCYKIA